MSPATLVSVPLRTVRNLVVAVALSVAMLIALTAVNPGKAEASVAHKSATAKAYAVSMLHMMNSERAYHHLRPLTLSWRLNISAYNHNTRQAYHNAMTHQFPGEPFFATRISNTGYHWSTAGENVAWNSDRTLGGVYYLQRLMYNEVAPNNGHRLNILSSKFTQVGIDVYFDGTHRKIWITQDFGHPANW